MKKILTILFLIVSLTIQAQFNGYPKYQSGHFYMWYTPTGWINCDSMIIRLIGIGDTSHVLRQLIANSSWNGRFYNLADTGIVLTTTVNKPLILGIPDAFSIGAHFECPGAANKFVDLCYPYPNYGINISNMGIYLQTSGYLTGYDPIYISASAGGQFQNVFKYNVASVNKFRVDSAGKVFANGYYNINGTAYMTQISILNLISDTARTWTDTIKHDRLNIIYATSVSFDTLRADTIIKIKSSGIPGAWEIKEWVGDGAHIPNWATSGIDVAIGNSYDPTKGVRNTCAFRRRHLNKVTVYISQQ